MKTKSILLLTLLVLTPLLSFAAVPVYASTGKIVYPEAVPISVRAGDPITLNFSQVTWSGAQFYLHWETDGLSQISSSPVTTSRYAGPFDVSNVTSVLPSGIVSWNYTFSYGTFYDGSLTFMVGNGWINGSIPFKTAGGDHWVKAFDGAATSVAVSDKIVVLPALKVSPSSGPAGYEVKITGSAFTANKLVNLTMTWTNDLSGSPKRFSVNITAGNLGEFTYNWAAAELNVYSAASRPVSITARDYESGRTDSATFNELKRTWWQIVSYDTSGNPVTDTGAGDWDGFGNTPSSTVSVNGQVMAKIMVNGTNFNPSGGLTFYWDYDLNTRFTVTPSFIQPLNGTGFFVATFIVPLTSKGDHLVGVVDATWSWNFTVTVGTTLVLNPTKGPVNTVVTATGYGYTPDQKVTLTWYGYFGSSTLGTKNITTANILVGSDGTWSMVFTVKNDAGGNHVVNGTTPSEFAAATFNITPTLVVVPSSSVGDGSVLTAVGTGFQNAEVYVILIDNNVAWPIDDIDMRGNATGYLSFEFFAIGAPGVHVVAIYYDNNENYDPSTMITPVASAKYTITGTTPDTQVIIGEISSLRSQVDSVLSAITSGFSDLKVDVLAVNLAVDSCCDDVKAQMATISNAISALSTGISEIKSDVAGVKSDVSSVKSDVAGVRNDVSSLRTDVAAVKSDVQGVKSDVAGISSDIGSVKTSISSVTSDLGGVTDDLDSVTTGVASATTFLYVVTALAAVTLLVELVILIRKR
jgi:archaellum component FlaC